MTQFGLSYREGRLKKRVRRNFASKDSRTGMSKSESARERRVLGVCYAMAVASLVGVAVTTEAGFALWVQLLPMASMLFWCGLAGLVETASTWQREYYALLVDRMSRD